MDARARGREDGGWTCVSDRVSVVVGKERHGWARLRFGGQAANEPTPALIGGPRGSMDADTTTDCGLPGACRCCCRRRLFPPPVPHVLPPLLHHHHHPLPPLLSPPPPSRACVPPGVAGCCSCLPDHHAQARPTRSPLPSAARSCSSAPLPPALDWTAVAAQLLHVGPRLPACNRRACSDDASPRLAPARDCAGRVRGSRFVVVDRTVCFPATAGAPSFPTPRPEPIAATTSHRDPRRPYTHTLLAGVFGEKKRVC